MTAASATRTLADAIGRGLVAGLIGTAAMTVSSTVEMRLARRGASTAPADAAATVLGVHPTDEGEQRFNTLVHWGYGTAWGTVRGLLGLLPVPSVAASALHLGAVWGAEQAVLPTLDVGAPVWEYGGKAVVTDSVHHSVYAAATGLAYEWLCRA